MDEWLGWDFVKYSQQIVVGETVTVEGPPSLYASRRPIDALEYATGSFVCRVHLGGEIVEGKRKSAGTERTVLWMLDATNTLRAFARWCALDVAHRWEMPEIVRRFLETGDEVIRAPAWNVAWDAAEGTVWVAARFAALGACRFATQDTAQRNARDAAWNAAAAAPAGTSAFERYNVKLETMLSTESEDLWREVAAPCAEGSEP